MPELTKTKSGMMSTIGLKRRLMSIIWWSRGLNVCTWQHWKLQRKKRLASAVGYKDKHWTEDWCLPSDDQTRTDWSSSQAAITAFLFNSTLRKCCTHKVCERSHTISLTIKIVWVTYCTKQVYASSPVQRERERRPVEYCCPPKGDRRSLYYTK